jgi:hypothetical protein
MSPLQLEAVEATLHALGDHYIEACRELCAAYDVDLRRDGGDLAAGNGFFRSVLRLAGPQLDLTSVLGIEIPLLLWTHAGMGPNGALTDPEDWCREFSHQLGGRLKNKLLPMGLELKVGLATLSREATEALHDVPAAAVQRCCFVSGKGWLRAELLMHASPRFTPLVPPSQGEALLEGTYLMF